MKNRNKNRKWIVARIFYGISPYKSEQRFKKVYEVDGDKRDFADFLARSLSHTERRCEHVVMDELDYYSMSGHDVERAKERIVERALAD